MNALRLLGYDVKYGILKRWYVFLITIVFAVAECKECFGLIQSLNECGYMFDRGTVMDYLIFSFQGMSLYTFDPRNPFTIPLFWFVFQIGASYVVAYYTENDLRKNGRNILMASKSRLTWWISKVVTCICSVLVYFFFTVLMITLFALINGASFSFTASDNFCVSIFSSTMLYLTTKDLVLIILVLPFVVTAAVCVCQIACSLVFSPVLCFATVSGIYVLSAYYTNPWFIGNYTMWQRCSYYVEGGVSPDVGFLMSIMLMVLAIGYGSYIIKRKDVF